VDISQLVKACKLVLGESVDYETAHSALKQIAGQTGQKESFGAEDISKVHLSV
jgi:hypothetical protein